MQRNIPGLLIVLLFSSCSQSETPRVLTAASPIASASTAMAVVNSPAPNVAVAPANKSKFDACTLLTNTDVRRIQGETIKETKTSENYDSGFAISQCFYTLPTFTNSISLLVARKSDMKGSRDLREFWKSTFHRDGDSAEEKERGREKEREREQGRKRDKDRPKTEKDAPRERGEEEAEKGRPPERVSGVGDEAYWTGSRVGGALYALKGNAYIRISVGGPGDQNTKIRKSKAIAQVVLKRL